MDGKERTSAASKAPAYRWLVFGLLAAAYFLVYFHRTSPAVVAVDLMADLKAGAALMGLLASAYFYPYALMQIPAGLLSDSWGPRRTITSFFILAGLASIAFGLVNTAGQATLARVAVGLGVSMLFVPTIKVMTFWFRPSEFSTVMGLLMAVGGLGVLSAAAPLAFLSSVLGWRGSFIAIGVVTLALALAIWIFVRNRPEDKGFPSLIEADAAHGAQEAIKLWPGVRMVIGSRSFWPVAIWFFFVCGVFFGFAGLWGGPFLMHVHGLSRAEAGGVLSMSAVGMVLGSPLLTFLSDRVFHSRKVILVAGAIMTVLLSGYLAFFPTAFNLVGLYIWVFLLSLSASASVVIAFTSTKELFPVSIAGTAVGLVNLFPFLGGAVWQVVVGLVLETQPKTGEIYTAAAYGRGFLVLFISALIGLAGSLALKDTLKGTKKVEAAL